MLVIVSFIWSKSEVLDGSKTVTVNHQRSNKISQITMLGRAAHLVCVLRVINVSRVLICDLLHVLALTRSVTYGEQVDPNAGELDAVFLQSQILIIATT